MKSRLLRAICACAITFVSLSAQAEGVSGQGTWETTLQGRLETALGSGVFLAYYDTVLDITWAADANINGFMDWNTSNAWAAGLTIGGVSGWSLLPVTMQDDQTRVLSVSALSLSRSLGVVYHRDRTLSNAARALTRLLA